MALPVDINNREYDKFVENSDGDVTVRTSNQSFSSSTGSDQVSEVAPALLLTQSVTLQDEITSVATSSAVNTLNFNKHTFQFDMGTSHTTVIEGSLDGTVYETIVDDKFGNDISGGSTTSELVQIDGKFKFLRVDTTAVNGALSVFYLGGN